MRTRYLLAGGVLVGAIQALPAAALQSASMPATGSGPPATRTVATELDSLVARALAANPSVGAASSRVDAARARVRPSAALPDPIVMLGIINQPLGSMAGTSAHGTTGQSGGPDPMTMRMVGVGQRLPYPGKLALSARAAERELDATQAALERTRRQVVRDVKWSYYELAYVDRAIAIVERNRNVLNGLIAVTESRYSVGTTGQQDVLKARVEATRLAETASALAEQQRVAVAQLNALLDQPGEASVGSPALPASVVRAAVASSSDSIQFVSASFGSRAANSPLRPLTELQDAAVQQSPEIREHEAMIAAQTARVELARKAYLPDVDVSLQYGQRSGGLPDMVSATVSVPIPLFKGRKQDQQVSEASAQLVALEAEHRASVNTLRAEVARLVSDIERERTRLALTVKAILPQSRAAMASAAASYQVGKVEFLTVLGDQATVFTYETEYFRALSDFAKNVAELERIVGTEVLR